MRMPKCTHTRTCIHTQLYSHTNQHTISLALVVFPEIYIEVFIPNVIALETETLGE